MSTPHYDIVTIVSVVSGVDINITQCAGHQMTRDIINTVTSIILISTTWMEVYQLQQISQDE